MLKFSFYGGQLDGSFCLSDSRLFLVNKRACVCLSHPVMVAVSNLCDRRSRTTWSKRQTDMVVKYFSQWIESAQLPKKKDIIQFLNRHSDTITYHWTVVRNKVLN